jgi:hypothetical protein
VRGPPPSGGGRSRWFGFIFLPVATLMWVLLDAPPAGVHGFDWFWIVLAVLIDLSQYVGAYTQGGQFPSRTSTA